MKIRTQHEYDVATDELLAIIERYPQGRVPADTRDGKRIDIITKAVAAFEKQLYGKHRG